MQGFAIIPIYSPGPPVFPFNIWLGVLPGRGFQAAHRAIQSVSGIPPYLLTIIGIIVSLNIAWLPGEAWSGLLQICK